MLTIVHLVKEFSFTYLLALLKFTNIGIEVREWKLLPWRGECNFKPMSSQGALDLS